jgi:hypothetical protein
MSAYFLIMAIGAVVLLAVWRWDERARRAELDRRRRLRLKQTSSPHDNAATPSPMLPDSVPTAAGQQLG